MSSRALSIVEEFASSDHTEDRISSAPALSAMQTPASIVRLVRLALSDTDLEVRNSAEQELLTLDGEALTYAVQELSQTILEQKNLNRQKKKSRLAAYGLLGQLRAQGHDVQCPPISFLQRLRLAYALPTYLYEPRNLRFRVRAWKWGLLGGSIGLGFFALLAIIGGRWEWNEQSLTYLGIGSLAVGAAALFAICLNQRTSPVPVQLDRVAGSLVEICGSTLFTFTFIAILLAGLICYLIYGGRTLKTSDFREMLIVLLALSMIAGATRAGVILGLGLYRRPGINRVVQMAIGVSISMAGIALLLLFFWRGETDARAISGPGGRTVTQFLLWLAAPFSQHWVVWLGLLPFFAGLAFTHIRIENESSPSQPIAGRVVTLLCPAILCLFTLVTGFSLHSAYHERLMLLESSRETFSVAFSPDSKLLVVENRNPDVVVWDMTTRLIRTQTSWFPKELKGKASSWYVDENLSYTFSPEGTRLAIWNDKWNEGIWNLSTQTYKGRGDRILASHITNQPMPDDSSYPTEPITALAFSPNGREFVRGDETGRVAIIDADSWEVRRTASSVLPTIKSKSQPELDLVGGTYTIRKIVFLPGGEKFITINRDGVDYWDYKTLAVSKQVMTFTEPMRNFNASPNGKFIVGEVDRDTEFAGTFQLWDTENSQTPPIKITSDARSIVIFADGKLLAENLDGSIRISHTDSRQPIVTLHGQGFRFEKIIISPDNKWLAASGYAGVRLWDISQWVKP